MTPRLPTLLLLLVSAAPATAQRLPEPRVADLFTAGPDAALVLAHGAIAGPLTVALRWPTGTPVTLALADGDLVARYPRPPADAAIATFSNAAGDRIARFDWGPDNLVLRAVPGQRLSAVAIADGLAITFAPLPADSVVEATAAGDPDADALLLAQADAATGYPGRARRRVAALVAAHPDDPALQAVLASTEYASGRTAAAARRYHALPDQGGAAGRIAARAVGPALETALLVRDGRGYDQTELGVRGGTPVTGSVRIEGGVRHVRTRGDDPSGADRTLRTRATEAGIAAAVDAAPALRLRFDLTGLVDGSGVGGAAAALFGDPERRGSLRLAWHLPDFATPTGALYGGWADRATAGGVLRIAPGATVRLDATLARYGLYGGGGARLTTTAFDGGIDYLIRRQSPSIAVGYRLDAEYVLDRTAIIGADPYATLTNRENHTGEATIGQPIGPLVALTGAAGWTVNRYGGNGPTAALGLSLVPVDGWEGGLLAGISSVSRPGQPERQLYGRAALTRRFGGQP